MGGDSRTGMEQVSGDEPAGHVRGGPSSGPSRTLGGTLRERPHRGIRRCCDYLRKHVVVKRYYQRLDRLIPKKKAFWRVM